MSNTGFKAINDSGTIQIDQDFRNLALISKGIGSTTTLLTPTTNSFVVMNFAGRVSPILVVIGPTGVGAAVGSGNISGGTATFTVQCFGGVGSTFTWYLFDVVASSTSHAGMRVYDAASNICYDSALTYLNIVDIVSVNVGGGALPTFSYTPGHSYAVGTQFLPFRVIDGPISPTQHNAIFTSAFCEAMSNGIKFTSASIGQKGPFSSVTNSNSVGSFFVVDVTFM